jgi:hypothetical protein
MSIRADRQIIDYDGVVAPTGRHGFAGGSGVNVSAGSNFATFNLLLSYLLLL